MALLHVEERNGTNSTMTTFADQLYSQFLLCPLCSQIYRQPKILTCQHSFCADCIEMHYEMDEGDRPYRFLLSYTRDLSCPICRKRTSLPNGGVRRLPDNFLVSNLVDVINRRKPMTSLLSSCQSSCEICSRRGSVSMGGAVTSPVGGAKPAAFKCLDCAKVLCSECAEQHRNTKVTSQHGLFSIGVEQDVECKIHKTETLRFYCEPCQTCVCVLCTFHDHKDHDVTSLLDGLQRHRGSFESLLDDCRGRIDSLRGQLKLIDSCETGLRLAEDHIRDAAIESIAAVRRREKQLLVDLRQAVGEKTFEFMADRKSLEDQLGGLESALTLTETMMQGTSVELLMLKKEMLAKLNNVLEPEVRPTPDGLRRTVQLLPEDCFGDVCKSELFGLGEMSAETADDGKVDSVEAEIQTDCKETKSAVTSTADDGMRCDVTSGTQTRIEDVDARPVVRPVITPAAVNHVQLTLSPISTVKKLHIDTDTPLPTAAQIAGSRRGSIQGRWPLEKSNSFSSTGDVTPPPVSAATPRNIPNFSRPKPPPAVLVDSATEMDPIVTVDTASWTPRIITCEKETSTGYVILVHKNVSTENQAMVDKGTSTLSNDVTAAYRNLTTTKRTVTVSRGTSTVPAKPTTSSERGTSPVRWPISMTSSAISIIPTSPTVQRPVVVTSSAAGLISIRTDRSPAASQSTETAVPARTPTTAGPTTPVSIKAAGQPQQQRPQSMTQNGVAKQQNAMTSRPTSLTSSLASWVDETCHQT